MGTNENSMILETSVKVSGNIISELSEKIPSNIVALNELIKNSYDAGSPYVKIVIDSDKNLLKIIDEGEGMDKSDIDTLFHLSKSTKSYGTINKFNRLTQGSKGLGFLSVFKFGKLVEWKTKKDIGYRFAVDFDDLLKCENITDYIVELSVDNTIKTGTEIIINLDNYSKQIMLEYLSKEKNYAKIINSFTDDNFLIILQVDNKTYRSDTFHGIKDHFKERQLFYINYNSDNGLIEYFHNDVLIKTFPYPFSYSGFKVNIRLSIYNFLPGQKSKIYNLFYNSFDELTPLIYVNDNLFNNFDIFDPSVMKTIKTGDMLNQMIGYVNIYSYDKLLSFNSDRTKFSQNKLTDNIISFLKDINIIIQREGSKIKQYLINYDFLKVNKLDVTNLDLSNIENLKKFIKDDFGFKNKVEIEVKDEKIVYKLFGKTAIINCFTKKTIIQPAEISLSTHLDNITIPSKQIDLSSYIISATNSAGNSIKNDVIIKIDGNRIDNNILESVLEEKSVIVEFTYIDEKTKLVKQELKINFIEPCSIIEGENDAQDVLLSIKAKQGYKVNFDNVVVNLINQINSLKLENYREVIACSLRTLFELSIKSLGQFNKKLAIINKLSYNFENDINNIIQFCNQKNIRTEIDKTTKISFYALKDLLIADDFVTAYRKSNLGPHSSTTYLTDDEIKFIAKKAALFVVLINELIKNPNIV